MGWGVRPPSPGPAAGPQGQERANADGALTPLSGTGVSCSSAAPAPPAATAPAGAEERLGGAAALPAAAAAGDPVDTQVQQYFAAHPDFKVCTNRLQSGWYTFGKPIQKKVFMKMAAGQVVVRTGGIYKRLDAWLDEYRCEEGRQGGDGALRPGSPPRLAASPARGGAGRQTEPRASERRAAGAAAGDGGGDRAFLTPRCGGGAPAGTSAPSSADAGGGGDGGASGCHDQKGADRGAAVAGENADAACGGDAGAGKGEEEASQQVINGVGGSRVLH